MSKTGIIGGTGVGESLVKAPNVFYLNRHGREGRPPHEIDFRGNITAMKKAGVEKIIATAAVGSMNRRMKPGDLVLLSDFMDFTRCRQEFIYPSSYTDVSFPYNEDLRHKIRAAAAGLKLKLHPRAVYVCTEGPRFETQAEIRMYRKLGGDVVGMTQVPEVVLAAEAKIPYAVIGIVTNYAAGVNRRKISADEVVEVMKARAGVLSELILRTIKLL